MFLGLYNLLNQAACPLFRKLRGSGLIGFDVSQNRKSLYDFERRWLGGIIISAEQIYFVGSAIIQPSHIDDDAGWSSGSSRGS
jgi:hypothetical protein